MNWSDVVRGGPAPKKSTLNPYAPTFTPRPPCVDCGECAEVCRRCTKWAVYDRESKGLCGHCLSANLPSESMCIGYVHSSNMAEQVPFKCSSCAEREPVRIHARQWASCEDCGQDQLHVCQHCFKRATNSRSQYCKECDLFESTGCPECDAEMDWPCLAEVDHAKEELFLCECCTEARKQDLSQVWSYWYWPADSSQPLSPTNVYRVPRYRATSEGPKDPVTRADEALAAYNEEMKFSGSYEEAMNIYLSFYVRHSKKKENPLKEGYVSLEEILAGQRVTARQFFDAVR